MSLSHSHSLFVAAAAAAAALAAFFVLHIHITRIALGMATWKKHVGVCANVHSPKTEYPKAQTKQTKEDCVCMAYAFLFLSVLVFLGQVKIIRISQLV